MTRNSAVADIETRVRLNSPQELEDLRKDILAKRDPTKL